MGTNKIVKYNYEKYTHNCLMYINRIKIVLISKSKIVYSYINHRKNSYIRALCPPRIEVFQEKLQILISTNWDSHVYLSRFPDLSEGFELPLQLVYLGLLLFLIFGLIYLFVGQVSMLYELDMATKAIGEKVGSENI